VPDELRSPIKRHLVLPRVDPGQGIRHFNSLMSEQDLFRTVRLVRNWGRIGPKGQELVEIHQDENAAGQTLEAVARAMQAERGWGSVNSRNPLCEERLLSFRFFLRPAAQVAPRRREQCRW
jgi:predicted DNA-binding WGR domain protein